MLMKATSQTITDHFFQLNLPGTYTEKGLNTRLCKSTYLFTSACVKTSANYFFRAMHKLSFKLEFPELDVFRMYAHNDELTYHFWEVNWSRNYKKVSLLILPWIDISLYMQLDIFGVSKLIFQLFTSNCSSVKPLCASCVHHVDVSISMVRSIWLFELSRAMLGNFDCR